MNNKKVEMQKCINDEHGSNYSKNIDLNGYIFYRGKSFISFKLQNIKNINVCCITYIYLVNKKDLIKLLSFCINFWAGNNCKYIYMLEHAREANYCEEYLESLGFKIVKEKRPNCFKHKFKSSNGFKEDEIIEYYL